MYTYGRNLRTHNAVLVLIKRTLTLWEVADADISPDRVLDLLKDDAQIHPVLRNAIKESLAQKEKSAWRIFWQNEEVSTPILQTIMNIADQQNRSLNVALKAALSLGAFEEARLPGDPYEYFYEDQNYDDWIL